MVDTTDPSLRDEEGNLLEGNGGNRDAGVSRGTTALELHTFLSKRIKYIEPYGGFRALFEFQNDGATTGRPISRARWSITRRSKAR